MSVSRALNGKTAARILAEAGPTLSLPDAAKVLGISRGLAYELAGRGEWPTKLLRLGARWRVPTASLRALVEADAA